MRKPGGGPQRRGRGRGSVFSRLGPRNAEGQGSGQGQVEGADEGCPECFEAGLGEQWHSFEECPLAQARAQGGRGNFRGYRGNARNGGHGGYKRE